MAKHVVAVAHETADRYSPESTEVVEDAHPDDVHSIPLPNGSTAQQGPDVPGAHDRAVMAPVVSLRVAGVLQVEPFQDTLVF